MVTTTDAPGTLKVVLEVLRKVRNHPHLEVFYTSETLIESEYDTVAFSYIMGHRQSVRNETVIRHIETHGTELGKIRPIDDPTSINKNTSGILVFDGRYIIGNIILGRLMNIHPKRKSFLVLDEPPSGAVVGNSDRFEVIKFDDDFLNNVRKCKLKYKDMQLFRVSKLSDACANEFLQTIINPFV